MIHNIKFNHKKLIFMTVEKQDHNINEGPININKGF